MRYIFFLLLLFQSNVVLSDEFATKLFIVSPTNDTKIGHTFAMIVTGEKGLIEAITDFDEFLMTYQAYFPRLDRENDWRNISRSEFVHIDRWSFPQHKPGSDRAFYAEIMDWGPGPKSTRFGGIALWGEFIKNDFQFDVTELPIKYHDSSVNYSFDIREYSLTRNNCAHKAKRLINQVYSELKPANSWTSLATTPHSIKSRLRNGYEITSRFQSIGDTV